MLKHLLKTPLQLARASQQYSYRHQSNTVVYCGVASLATLFALKTAVDHEENQSVFKPLAVSSPIAQCEFQDKELIGCVDKIKKGFDGLKIKYPGWVTPKLKSGLKGTRYFIEAPISGEGVDIKRVVNQCEKLIRKNAQQFNAKVKNSQVVPRNPNVSYIIEFETVSKIAESKRASGSLFLRGVLNSDEHTFEKFTFSLEKSVDFCDMDSQLMVTALEEVAKMQQASRKAKSKDKATQEGDSKEGNQTPMSILEGHGCRVFHPDEVTNKYGWDYLAGYEKVKRNIEDTILLALTNASVYDQITSLTRMKKESNKPKCVLFEGPPGCGKTTSARIISHQVKIPLIYMPLEAIMSKMYGESESRLAEIFEAAQALGGCILFIDEIDSLATSRETGLYEATRRILSTLLRKIDSFESEGEVLVICATNRKKDLDPALISRADTSIRFELPDAQTRTEIFKRYAKQLSQDDLERLGEMAVYLSGRDLCDICKDAERKWASMYIRKEVSSIKPDVSVYVEATQARLFQMKDANLRMDLDTPQQAQPQFKIGYNEG